MFNEVLGTTKECLKHFSGAFQKLTNIEQEDIANNLVVFLGVSGKSVQSWVDGKTFPRGVDLLRLRYYLESLGYIITEIKDLPESVKELNKLIANRIINIDDAIKDMCFPDLSEMTRVLLGKRVTSNKVKIIEDYLKNIKDKGSSEMQESSPELPVQPEISPVRKKVKGHSFLIYSLKILDNVEELISPQLRELLENSNDLERVELREKLEKNFLFSLSNKIHELTELLNALCSEKAREAKLKSLRLGLKTEKNKEE